MKTKSMKLAFLTLCGLILLPHVAGAYEVTDSKAMQLDDNTYLFTISYKFGFLNRDMATPVLAARNSDVTDKVGYEIEVNDAPASGIVGAVVLTNDEDVSEQNSQYVLPEKKNAEFTLVGIVRTASDVEKAVMKITNLPFLIHNNEEVEQSEVTEDELLEYRSPTLIIGDGGVVSIKTSVVSVNGEIQ
tara:strand:- start:3639 stop:4202 length:564 start_codon:yes stop_codon:yes gene_type:complete